MTVYRPDNDLGLEVVRDGEVDLVSTKVLKEDSHAAQVAFEIYSRGLKERAAYQVCGCGGAPWVCVVEPLPAGKRRAVAKCTLCGHRWLTEHA